MYEHYERHRTDNITDPAVRRSQPISTISGWDRDQDDSIETQLPATQPISNGQSNGPAVDGEPQLKTRKVSKSEQTEDIGSVDLDGIKCACEDEDKSSISNPVQTEDAATSPIATATVSEGSKTIISNISQVYNEQISGSALCNGNAHTSASEDESISSPQKEATIVAGSGAEALRQVLEIESYDDEEENKEIVQELVEEILQKSESLLDDCQKTLRRENHLDDNETSSPVIKDDEIELAVSEVVKGVREIEKKVKLDNEKNQLKDANAKQTAETVDKTDNAAHGVANGDDNQKTDLVLSSAIISNNNLSAIDFEEGGPVDDDDEEAVTINEDIIVKTKTGSDNNRSVHVENCDNEVSSCGENNNGIDSNDMETDVANVVNELIGEAIKASKIANEPTKEDFVKSIVDEIVERCVSKDDEQERNNNKINNNVEGDSTLNTSTPETELRTVSKDVSSEAAVSVVSTVAAAERVVSQSAAEQTNTSKEPNEVGAREEKLTRSESFADSTESIPQHLIKAGRSQSISTSTSTQVENNHFGKS